MLRLRIRYTEVPRRALILTDTPRPDCRKCDGEGGANYHYGDPETGEYAGTDWDPCTCWNEDRCWVLLPLPRRRASRDPQASNEPPF
ncbi:hypothetical protein ACFP1Z_25425 [Streptomyces gamaensis]|uniref:Uncharacterized protein n=1 Tax=Streptomyces gamaensis TaxID=1763542 RepID=A0ABW0ZAU4_9ACTN